MPNKEDFGIYGPSRLTSIDWRNPNHRRCVMASLVQGVKIIERDREKDRLGPRALAPPWWKSFHFELHKKIVDPDVGCIFGAIYRHKSPASNSIPKYVIAFRGTLPKLGDTLLDINVAVNNLHNTNRFQQALEIVEKMVALTGAANVWLAGYSLGAAIALLAGKKMAKMRYHPHLLKTYLFSPPFVSLSLESMEDQELKQRINLTRILLRGAIACAKYSVDDEGGYSQQFDDPFAAISGWVPHLFVNRGDLFCSAYIGYFQNREYMNQIGLGRLESLASGESIIRNILSTRKREPEHLLASAELNINSWPSTDLKSDHSLRQWWCPNLICVPKVYRYE